MASRIIRYHDNHRDDLSVISASTTDEPTSENVTYLSKNRDGRKFEAVTPANSVHANKLAEIAMLVQSNQRQSKSHRKHRASLAMSSSRPIVQIDSIPYQEPAPRVQPVPYSADSTVAYDSSVPQVPGVGYVSSSPMPPTSQAPPMHPSTSSSAPPPSSEQQNPRVDGYHDQQYREPQGPSPPSSQYAVAAPDHGQPQISDLNQRQVRPITQYQAPEVHRYTTEQKTGYRVKSHTGELKVSAPVGSSEAAAFDGVAHKLSSKEKREHSDERRVARHSSHKQRERSSGGWGWRWS